MFVVLQPRPGVPQRPGGPRRPGGPEDEWREKLFGECDDEFFESFGVYDGICCYYCIELP